ncbi:Cof-type HAD-IIB family hydrolase [Staphylococcus carnosus]|uniref:Predicted hydrolases of the HAD superfamily n=2 Tax=Staphylococcus carnosus TaxID=1281 RepID=B9DIS6_STACT|nr:Cof-type HAD-IIB family hydrolase [Staphylococcus carnosus]ANZ33807.1 phosphatase [Staphylococcus carnosus]KKB24823.1 phosphatase [Staphylococcus carnosus]KOR14047.1 phosphatase [Staphylococcus carnosus]POA02080.1 Cof-type HAD-IIB family hydrolase [Staphylococcus carnosus]QPT03670.1 Cof-type HAD-IIB family hydrolase [Staphylococcus carnosus]
MEPYLICLDLDGTLLNDKKEISPYTLKVLEKLKEQGHYIMIATGRPFRASKPYYEQLKLNTPIVNFNGAFVHNPTDPDSPVIHETLDPDLATSIIESLQKMQVKNIIAEVKDHVYIDNFDQHLFDGFSMGNPKIETGDIVNQLKEPPTSILIEADEVMIPRVKQMLSRFYAESIEHRRWGAPFPVIEIVKRGISKARGIDSVKDELGVDRNHIIAFGDEDNDTEMIKYAKHGIAMENGLDELKHIANEVTYSNNDDGIGRYLNDFFSLNIPYNNETKVYSR